MTKTRLRTKTLRKKTFTMTFTVQYREIAAQLNSEHWHRNFGRQAQGKPQGRRQGKARQGKQRKQGKARDPKGGTNSFDETLV